MRLTNLTADGLKNLRDIDLEVPPLLALTGPNGSGKSALLQAIRLGVLGYDPEIGRTLAATRTLAGDDRGIAVGLTFDSGFGIRRILGKSTETDVAPPAGESTEKERQARIEEETGAFPFSFDLAAFLDLSAEKRRDFLFELLPREAADLDEAMFRDWLGYEEADEVIQRGIDHLWQHHVLGAQTAIDGLATAIDEAHAKMLQAERERQTQAKISAAADRDAADASEDVSEYDPDRLDELQVEVTTVEQRLGEIRQAEEEAQRRQREHQHRLRVAYKRVDEEEDALKALRQQLARVPDGDKDAIDQAVQRVNEARAAVDAFDPPTEDQQATLTVMEANHAEAKEALEDVMRESNQVQAQREALAKDVAKIERRLDALQDGDACPTCGNTADLDHVRKVLRDDLSDTNAQIDALPSLRDQLEERFEAERAAREALEEARREIENANDARRFRLQAELVDAQDGLAQLRTAADQRQSLEARIEEAERRRARAVEEMNEIRSEDISDSPAHAAERERLAKKAAAIREELRALQQDARADGKAEAERERADRERRKLETAEYRAEALKAVHSGLQKLRARAIQDMVGPVEAMADEILRAIDPAKIFAFRFEREGKPVLEFGFEEDGVFRSYDAASTGEDAFLAVVLVAATVATVSPPWRVLMVDNVEQVDDVRRAALQEALARPEIADLFDNVILAGCCPFEAIEGWEVAAVDELTGTPVEAAA